MELTGQLFFFVAPVRLTMAVVMVVKDELASWFCIPEGVNATRLRTKTTPTALQGPPCNRPAGQMRPKNAILRYLVIDPLRRWARASAHRKTVKVIDAPRSVSNQRHREDYHGHLHRVLRALLRAAGGPELATVPD